MWVIDAHQHVWDPAVVDYPWLTPGLGPLNRAFTHADVQHEMAAVGVTASILVQAADNLADTAFMLLEAARSPTVAGVVAWVPLDNAKRVIQLLDGWQVAGASVVGVRHLIHREPDPDWVLRPDVLSGFDVLIERGLPFDFCAESLDLLRNVGELAEQRPDLSIVVDHLGKPPIASCGWQPWARLLNQAAAHANVVAKLSGLNTAARAGRRGAKDYQPYVDHALEVFGSTRLMYGGDWPFALLGANSYQDIWNPLRQCLNRLSESELAAVLGDTASRIYHLRPVS